ncbi:thiolase family protein [Glutamicibacter sp. PS]|uniref:thiolase family protein n=1 Tax=Glutamicibacter sp. PS TaxID=3075634 RepID=UPI00284461DB|nr:thiolase family protein [Glutamicibacter sp. PS]MDR4532932.1 thiolase family protein [Glutamicibacter sp. PS]
MSEATFSRTKIAILAGARTATGRYGGQYASLSTTDLGIAAARGALQRSALSPEDVDEVILGCIGQVGPESYNARAVALGAGLPQTARAMNVNRLCGSGLQAVFSAAQSLALGVNDVVLAGGNESMTSMPYLDYAGHGGPKLSHRKLLNGTLAMLTDPFSNRHMGTTAENVAEKFGIDRSAQDNFALRSQQRAASERARQVFAEEIIDQSLLGHSEPERDEHPRPDTTGKSLAALAPAFAAEGTVTAGNSSGVNDGAAVIALARLADAQAQNLPVLATLEHVEVTGYEPSLMGYAPVAAIKGLLERTGVDLERVGVIELNEAFAAQAVAVIRDAGLDPERVNAYGGAIALGHPVGATGAILTLRAAMELARGEHEYAIVSLCIGGGQGIAALLRRG